MLHPRETDLPVLFLVFVVLPLVVYVLLGKWSEASKKKERIRMLAQIAAEESFRAEAMVAAAAASTTTVPLVPVSKPHNGFHECARCFSPATTRCSRCKTVRYCSGKCQIIHWRQVHKQECRPLDYNSSCASPKSASNDESVSVHERSSFSENLDSQWFEPNIEQYDHDKHSCKFNRETASLDPSADTCSTSYDNIPPKEKYSVAKTHKSVRSPVEVSRDQTSSTIESTSQITDSDASRMRDPKGNSIVNKGFMKMIGLKRSSKHDRVEASVVNGDRHKKIKMLFPYEEFVKFFQYEAFDTLPRGLVNCGNSCYANAVLQCLMSTKPLTIYMLHRSHSRACCAKGWCLMCELEHHVMMLQEHGEPLSLSRILLHMRNVHCQIGDGSQEDAHEFLRLLITSMQSICLEGLGGEDVVDPKLQETTFIQQTFGGQLRSKVKCLRCHHESVIYENIMDLTLEIFGWVKSLEDALTQFTSPEDLDGENMYRCGRCATYVRARKQLGIQEAPNILTIVLKRFQEGSYGKLNKRITYPDMLDMIPFMTGTDDMPPLYMLYGVVVHLDTMNASFSGHYISYVKDLRGNWFRIDDAQVHQVPLSQVMSEGAYILFYTRSSPRPPRNHVGKPSKHQSPAASKSKPPKSTLDPPQEPTGFQGRPGFRKPASFDFSDATSSDCSIFTSSDDASFTTESTRDSFSTVDYADHLSDPVSAIFNVPFDYSTRNTVSCSRFSRSRPHTRFTEAVKSCGGGEPPYRLRNSGEGFGCSNGRYVDGIMNRTYGLNC